MGHRKHSANVTTHARQHINLKLERWHRLSVYGCVIAMVVTGCIWLFAHYTLRGVGEFGIVIHPLEPWSMKLHGGLSMVTLIFLGSLINSHIRRAHKAARNLWSGWFMIVTMLTLIMTGYALYYWVSESSRPVWSIIHWAVGLALPMIIVIHIALGRRAKQLQQK